MVKKRLDCLFCRQCQLRACPECLEQFDKSNLAAGKYVCECNSRMVKSRSSSFVTGRFAFGVFPEESVRVERVEQFVEEPRTLRTRVSKMMGGFCWLNPFDRDLTSKSRCANFGTLLKRFLAYLFVPALLAVGLLCSLCIFKAFAIFVLSDDGEDYQARQAKSGSRCLGRSCTAILLVVLALLALPILLAVAAIPAALVLVVLAWVLAQAILVFVV